MDENEREATVVVAARVAPELRRRLEVIAKAEDRPISSVVRRVLQMALKQYEQGTLQPPVRR